MVENTEIAPIESKVYVCFLKVSINPDTNRLFFCKGPDSEYLQLC